MTEKKTKTVTMIFPMDMYQEIRRRAYENERNVSSQVRFMVHEQIKQEAND